MVDRLVFSWGQSGGSGSFEVVIGCFRTTCGSRCVQKLGNKCTIPFCVLHVEFPGHILYDATCDVHARVMCCCSQARSALNGIHLKDVISANDRYNERWHCNYYAPNNIGHRVWALHVRVGFCMSLCAALEAYAESRRVVIQFR